MNVLIRFDFIYRPPLCTMRFNEMKLFLFDLNSDSSAFSALLFLLNGIEVLGGANDGSSYIYDFKKR